MTYRSTESLHSGSTIAELVEALECQYSNCLKENWGDMGSATESVSMDVGGEEVMSVSTVVYVPRKGKSWPRKVTRPMGAGKVVVAIDALRDLLTIIDEAADRDADEVEGA